MKKWLALLKHPTGVVVAIGLIILATEFLIMALIDFHQATILKDLSLQKWIIFIDPIVLIVIVSPLIYLLIFKPLNQQAELMRAINSLEESEQHLQAVAQSANDAIISADSVGNIVDWNDAAERLFGYAKIEMIGQPITRLMPERFRNLHRDGMARVVAGGAPHVIGKTVELAGLHKDGSEFPLEFSLAQWRAADGQFFTAIIRDITERKRTETQLIEQLDELRRWHNATSGREGRILELKHEINELLGQAGQPPRYPSAET